MEAAAAALRNLAEDEDMFMPCMKADSDSHLIIGWWKSLPAHTQHKHMQLLLGTTSHASMEVRAVED